LWKDKCNEKAAELAALKDRGGDGKESVAITPALSADVISPVIKTPSKLFIRDTRKQKSNTWNSKSTIVLEDDEENEGELKVRTLS